MRERGGVACGGGGAACGGGGEEGGEMKTARRVARGRGWEGRDMHEMGPGGAPRGPRAGTRRV